MSYSIKSIAVFEKQAKKLVKKYRSLKGELTEIITELKENPLLGTSIGNNCYKIRMAISSKNKGKSGGARLITTFTVADETVFLLSIYDKSEKDSLSDKELDELLAYILD